MLVPVVVPSVDVPVSVAPVLDPVLLVGSVVVPIVPDIPVVGAPVLVPVPDSLPSLVPSLSVPVSVVVPEPLVPGPDSVSGSPYSACTEQPDSDSPIPSIAAQHHIPAPSDSF